MLKFVGVVTNQLAAPPATKENEPIQFIVIAAEPILTPDQEIIGPVEEGAVERIQPVYIYCLIPFHHPARD
jgi:hypothetical protein